MKHLHTRVNLIPIIAKSDTLTDEEIATFKQQIIQDLNDNGIRIFQPSISEWDDAETVAETKEIVSRIPFAVVGSVQEIELGNGRKVRGRKYPWGVIEGKRYETLWIVINIIVDNEDHNDFVKLRQMLIHTNMEELKETTNTILYESYRTQKLSGGNYSMDTNGEVK